MSEEEINEIIKEFLELKEIHSNNSLSKSYLSIYQEAIQRFTRPIPKGKRKEYENDK